MASEAGTRGDYLLDRLGRRGTLTITVSDGQYEVRLDTPGPYGVGGRCTIDKGDLFEHCHLGAKGWRGEGPDLAALLTECDEASRPRSHEIGELRWSMERRRETRTHGPELPTYRRWDGWRPPVTQPWLRTSNHAYEYLGGYLRDLQEEREFDAEQRASQERRRTQRQFATKRALDA